MNGVPFLMFRFSPLKELTIEGLEITYGSDARWSDGSVAVIEALAPASTTSIASVKVHGFLLRSRPDGSGTDCTVAADDAHWNPAARKGDSWLDLRGGVSVRAGGSEVTAARARLFFGDQATEVRGLDGAVLGRLSLGKCELAG